jgi:hypothetical protein
MVIEVRLEHVSDIPDYCFKHGGIRFADNGSYGGTPDILRYGASRTPAPSGGHPRHEGNWCKV